MRYQPTIAIVTFHCDGCGQRLPPERAHYVTSHVTACSEACQQRGLRRWLRQGMRELERAPEACLFGEPEP